MRSALPLSMLALGAALLSGTTPARPDGPAADCASLRRAYAAALAEAQACRPEAAEQCGAVRPGALDDPCHCQAPVNAAGAAELDRILARYRERACPAAAGLCNRRCVAPVARCLARPGAPARCG